jgi:hypothetical protein
VTKYVQYLNIPYEHLCEMFYMVDELATLLPLKYFSHSHIIKSLQKMFNYFNGKSVAGSVRTF